MSTAHDTIKEQVTTHPVVLYMKGTPQFPQCGFSATTVEILKRCGVTDYQAVDVLQDPEIRQGIKEYANWPTIPQLYVKGGDYDIEALEETQWVRSWGGDARALGFVDGYSMTALVKRIRS